MSESPAQIPHAGGPPVIALAAPIRDNVSSPQAQSRVGSDCGRLGVVTVTRRLAQGFAALTLTVYVDLFQKTALTAASAIEARLWATAQEP